MEATGVYWKPVYYCLEGLFDELWLCNAQHVKNVPGRKTDLSDAEWLVDVAAHGMVRPSFVPPPEISRTPPVRLVKPLGTLRHAASLRVLALPLATLDNPQSQTMFGRYSRPSTSATLPGPLLERSTATERWQATARRHRGLPDPLGHRGHRRRRPDKVRQTGV